jgi:hypothetical protein
LLKHPHSCLFGVAFCEHLHPQQLSVPSIWHSLLWHGACELHFFWSSFCRLVDRGPVFACRVEWVETPTLKDDQTARLAYKSGLRIVKLLGHVRRDKQRSPKTTFHRFTCFCTIILTHQNSQTYHLTYSTCSKFQPTTIQVSLSLISTCFSL